MKNGIRFGWAETDITPRQKIALAGQFYERATTEVETPITVTALAIDTGDEQTVLCSCDIAHVTEELTAAARARMTGEGSRASRASSMAPLTSAATRVRACRIPF